MRPRAYSARRTQHLLWLYASAVAPPRLVSYVEIPRMPQLVYRQPHYAASATPLPTLALLLSQVRTFRFAYPAMMPPLLAIDDDAYTILCV